MGHFRKKSFGAKTGGVDDASAGQLCYKWGAILSSDQKASVPPHAPALVNTSLHQIKGGGVGWGGRGSSSTNNPQQQQQQRARETR